MSEVWYVTKKDNIIEFISKHFKDIKTKYDYIYPAGDTKIIYDHFTEKAGESKVLLESLFETLHEKHKMESRFDVKMNKRYDALKSILGNKAAKYHQNKYFKTIWSASGNIRKFYIVSTEYELKTSLGMLNDVEIECLLNKKIDQKTFQNILGFSDEKTNKFYREYWRLSAIDFGKLKKYLLNQFDSVDLIKTYSKCHYEKIGEFFIVPSRTLIKDKIRNLL